jgi:hypothetical protein
MHKSLAAIAAVLVGCQTIGDADDYQFVYAAGTSGTTSGAGGQGGGLPPKLQCGESPTPSANGCPAVCTSCSAGVCLIDCAGGSECKGKTLTCPTGMHCEVRCDADAACSGAIVECPEDYACSLTCDGALACENAHLECSAIGPCKVTCGKSTSCQGTAVFCGENACDATCSDGSKPKQKCSGACSCKKC